ncbi:MAG: type II CAAX endopeptidase family protein [Verrucomicrobiota bacterium]
MDELAAMQVLLDVELILLIGLALGVLISALWRRLRGALPTAGDYDHYDLLLMLFPALLFLLNPIGQLLIAQSSDTEVAAESTSGGLQGILFNLAYFTFVGVMTFGILEWIRGKRVVELFGLRRLSLPVIVVTSIIAGVVSVLICVGLVGGFSNSLVEEVFDRLQAQEPVRNLQKADSHLYLGLSILNACVAAAVVEELLFRGYMYGAIKNATNSIFAIFVVGGLFAVVHGNLPAMLPLWVFSILLCLAYEWSRCLWVPIGMHVFFNATNIVLMMSEHSGD